METGDSKLSDVPVAVSAELVEWDETIGRDDSPDSPGQFVVVETELVVLVDGASDVVGVEVVEEEHVEVLHLGIGSCLGRSEMSPAVLPGPGI